MAFQAQPPNAQSDVKQRSANDAPSIWGDRFLSDASMEVDIKLQQHIQGLKEEVKRMLMASVNKPSQKLDMIDNIQRLGISYHFENEINEILRQIHKNSCRRSQDLKNDEDLYTTALRFRLLRQQGYNVSCEMFNKFRESNGTFQESLVSDIAGLLSLYEAAHLMVHGEDVLDEAMTFTKTHLKYAAHGHLSSPFSKQVTHALCQPLWWGVPRIEARHYLSTYEEDESHNKTLLTLAKLDFNLVQKVHQKELLDISRCWKDLDFANKLPLARDRIVESYLWVVGVYFEPEYQFARMILCMYVALTTVIDDIYDVYGSYEELHLFTEAVESWDNSAADQLTECTKACYQALLDIYSGFEEKLAEEGNLYRMHYAREAIKIQFRAYFQEVKWLNEKYTPTMDQYLLNGLDSSFFPMVITSFVGMGGVVTKDSMEWALKDPKILNATSLIARVLNDMTGHKVEQTREQGASSVECYMNEYDVTKEEAKFELTKQVNNAWKDINKEWLALRSSSTIPRPLLQVILNHARTGEILYRYEDRFTDSQNGLKSFVDSLFIDPVSV